MRKIFILSLLYCHTLFSYSQITLTIDGVDTTYFDVPRTSPTSLTIKSSLFTSDKAKDFVVIAGDDSYVPSKKNNLDGAKILGNKFVWTAYEQYPNSILHGVMLGYNINYTVKHNYNDGMPYAFIYKGGNDEPMEWTSGAHSYNIHKNVKIGVNVKGMSGVKIYNNTFFNNRYSNWHHIGILENNGSDQNPPYISANNTIIKNNIFYQKANSPAIKLFPGSQDGLEIDYNIYWCEECVENTPEFEVEGNILSWIEWQALGYDLNSKIMNPNFIDMENFAPTTRLDFGTDLDETFQYGIAANAVWSTGEYPDTIKQNGKWQVGAVLKFDNSSAQSLHTYHDSIKTYPNPNNGIFFIDISQINPAKEIIINIYSLDGTVIFNKRLSHSETLNKIDISQIKAGFYILSIDNINITQKVIKL